MAWDTSILTAHFTILIAVILVLTNTTAPTNTIALISITAHITTHIMDLITVIIRGAAALQEVIPPGVRAKKQYIHPAYHLALLFR